MASEPDAEQPPTEAQPEQAPIEPQNEQPPTEPQSEPLPTEPEAEADPGRAGATAYYVWPLLWLGAAPDNLDVAAPPGEIPPDLNPEQLEDVVVEIDLPQNLRARAHRDGLIVFDFSRFAPYVGAPDQAVEFFELSKLVLRRLALMNAHVACLHTALR